MLKVSGSGKAPPHIIAVSSPSTQSRYSRQRGRAERVLVAVQIEAGDLAQHRAGIEVGVRLT